MTAAAPTFNAGDIVRVDGELGTFRVLEPVYAPDGSVRLYGGDKDPNGRRCHRAIRPERLKPDKRKHGRGAP
jgi:hypothetical protein